MSDYYLDIETYQTQQAQIQALQAQVATQQAQIQALQAQNTQSGQ